MRNPNPVFRNCSDKFFVFRNGKTCPVAHLSLDTGALKTTEGKAEVPSLDKEGWLRPLRKCREASLAGADGHERSECEPDRAKQGRMVGSSHRLSELERTTPAAPPKERDHLLDGAATPPLPRRGLRLFHPLSETSAPAAVASQLFLCGAATPPVPGVPGGDHVFRAVFGLTWSQS